MLGVVALSLEPMPHLWWYPRSETLERYLRTLNVSSLSSSLYTSEATPTNNMRTSSGFVTLALAIAANARTFTVKNSCSFTVWCVLNT